MRICGHFSIVCFSIALLGSVDVKKRHSTAVTDLKPPALQNPLRLKHLRPALKNLTMLALDQ